MNAVAKKQEETKALSLAQDLSSWGDAPVSSKDLVIPRILLMNGTSDLVTSGEAGFGELRDSLTNRKLGDLKNPVRIIPFAMKKSWIEYEIDSDGEKEYLRKYDVTPQNENQKYEGEGEGREGGVTQVSRDYVMEFYVLLESDVRKGGELPYIITFRRTALKNGKKLATQMYVSNRGAKLPPPGMTLELCVKIAANDDNKWAVLDVNLDPEVTKATDAETITKCLDWYKMINTMKVHEDSYNEDASTEQAPSGESVDSGPAKF